MSIFSKKCGRCNKELAKNFEFCPFCGANLRKQKEEQNFGLLGREDNFFDMNMVRMPFGFNKLFNSLVKELDKQFKELDKEMTHEIKEKKVKKPQQFPNNSGISIKISTSTGKQPEINISGFGPEFEKIKDDIEEKPVIRAHITDEQAKKYSKLPKKEAMTKVRRLSNKIVYEITLPGVKSLKEVIINKLENSIEIKAFSKDSAYFKLLPVNLPLVDYKLQDEKLILELQTNQ
ncbi:MAG: zinc ribbon domain-containing protein [archaeon]